MSHQNDQDTQLLQTQNAITTRLNQLFAPEDDVLQQTITRMQNAGLPSIQISPLQGKFLQFLALACNARKILEIGSLGGYSGIWLARSLPTDGRLITLEVNPHHAEVVRNSFEHAGVTNQTEVRIGKALDLLPQLVDEAPFDLIFIDADKAPYPQYLEWAIRLSRPGSIIVGDNCIRGGKALAAEEQDPNNAGLVAYNRMISNDPRLCSLALAIDDNHTDGFAISVVCSL